MNSPEMFNIPDRFKRKYQCFCCGVQFQEWDKFTDHIIENHEEGREYVLCPLKRCQAPVRCISSHFKAKHPGEKLPPVKQLKAMIWKDFSGDKKRTRKPRFRQGFYQSNKMNQVFPYRSGYELTVLECLDTLNEVAGFHVEPVEIPYLFKGKTKKYIPDLFVKYIDGTIKLLEIKPSSQTTLEINQCKWIAATEACHVRGWEFMVITEKGIDEMKRKVKDQKMNDKSQ